MPRPSLKQARQHQILDAAETCITHYGVEGLTLERVAEEADLARALIRHNVGNRDDLIEAVTERFLVVSREEMDALFAALPASRKAPTLVEWLFDPAHTNTKTVLVADALMIHGAKHQETARRMRLWTETTWRDIAALLGAEYPEATQERINAAAAGVLGLFFNWESSATLGPMTAFRTATKDAALILLDGLENRT